MFMQAPRICHRYCLLPEVPGLLGPGKRLTCGCTAAALPPRESHTMRCAQIKALRAIAPNPGFMAQLQALEAARAAQPNPSSSKIKPPSAQPDSSCNGSAATPDAPIPSSAESPSSQPQRQGAAQHAEPSVPRVQINLGAAVAQLLDIAAGNPEAVTGWALRCHSALLVADPDPAAAIPALIRAAFEAWADRSDRAGNARACLAQILCTAAGGTAGPGPAGPDQADVSAISADVLLRGLQAVFSPEPWRDLTLDVPLAGSFAHSFLDACRPSSMSQQQQQYSRLYDVAAAEGPGQNGASEASSGKVSNDGLGAAGLQIAAYPCRCALMTAALTPMQGHSSSKNTHPGCVAKPASRAACTQRARLSQHHALPCFLGR